MSLAYEDATPRDSRVSRLVLMERVVSTGYVECIRLLLEFGANGTTRMSMGWTPAHSSAEAGKLSALRALVTAGVAVDRKDKYGDTPRRVAEIYGHKECAAFLAQYVIQSID